MAVSHVVYRFCNSKQLANRLLKVANPLLNSRELAELAKS